jgi:ABC-type multidrug transport system fused ATPase/permease subunit
MKFRNRIYRFMQGRNGVDALARFINIVGFVFVLTALLFTILSAAFWRHAMTGPATVFTVLHYVFYGIGLILMILWIFRILSRNVAKRQAENTRFLYRKQKIRRKFGVWKQRWKERKTYRYFKCPKCKQQMRAPRKKGKIRVTCRNCGHVFETKT